jgi:hypothetical protein
MKKKKLLKNIKIKNNFFKDKSKFYFIMIFMLIKINLFMIFFYFLILEIL